MAEAGELRRITTKVPSRSERLPWSRWHWLVVAGLDTVGGPSKRTLENIAKPLTAEDTPAEAPGGGQEVHARA